MNEFTQPQQPQQPPAEQPNAQDMIARRLEALERNLNGVSTAVQSFSTRQQQSDVESRIQQQLRTAGDAVAQAERAYREARETGDIDAELAANRKLAAAVADESRVKAEVDAYRRRAQEAPPQRNAPLDDTELQKFRAQNKWFGTDQEMTQTSLAFAREIEASGIVKGTPAYFSEVQRRMRERYPDRMGASSPPVAGAGSGGHQGDAPVRFSHEQLQTWRSMGIDTSNPDTLKQLAGARQQAASSGLLPEKPPSSLGRVFTQR